MRFLLAISLALTATIALGQDNFPPIREQGRPDTRLRVHDGPKAISHLVQIGIGPMDGAWQVLKPRYGRAMFVHAAWIELDSIVKFLEGNDNDGASSFKAVSAHEKDLPVACLEVVKLADEYRAELTTLDADVDQMKSRGRDLAKRFEAVLLKRFLGRHAPHPSPDWSIRVVREMKKSGWLFGYPDGLGRPPDPKNPYEIAVRTHAVMTYLTQMVSEFEKLAGQFASGDLRAESAFGTLKENATYIKQSRPIEADLYRLVEEFYFELINLGADPQDMISLIDNTFSRIAELRVPVFGEAVAPFSDIPDSHWAARAANELKQAGILVGDGHGHFGG